MFNQLEYFAYWHAILGTSEVKWWMKYVAPDAITMPYTFILLQVSFYSRGRVVCKMQYESRQRPDCVGNECMSFFHFDAIHFEIRMS